MLGLFTHKVVEEECEPLMTLEEYQAVRRKENDFLNPAALEVMKETYGSIKLTRNGTSYGIVVLLFFILSVLES